MLSKYIQAPYIETLFGLATPALIISVIYLFVLGVFLVFAKNKGILKIGFVNFRRLMRGEKNKIIISIIGFIVFIFSCINLPEFLGEDNILLGISGTYLKFETLVYLLLFAFLCTAFLNNTNRETHIKAANRIFHYLIWISLGTGILFGQLDYAYWKNIVVIASAWILNGLLFIVDIESVQENTDNPAKFDLIPYGAVDSADDLFPLHKQQAEDIVSIISSSSLDPFSICLSGEWGTGKTSVMHGVVELLKENEDKPYDIIYINALELDDKKTALTYLMTQIREKLKSRGVYVGINSEYKEFVASFTGTLTSSTIGTFLQKKLVDNDDYRAQKMKLETVLERIYKNGKLIVVVDDIERCDRDTAREYLFLIKEVATMRSCVSIFITDYDMLNEVVSVNNTSKNSRDFLNKFFNYKIDLRDEAPKDIFAFYDGFFDDRDPAFWSIYRIICKSPGSWYSEAVAGLTAKLNELEADNRRYYLKNEDKETFERKIQEHKENCLLFAGLMQNPRNVAKFYNVFRNHALQCGKYLRLTTNSDKVSKYISSRNIGQVLYLISFVEVFLPAEYERLKQQGPRYIDPLLYGMQAIDNVNERLLVELAQGLVFGRYYELGKMDGYVKEDIKKFLKNYLSGNTDLCQLINPFTSQEEEWINAIDTSNNQVIEDHWEEMVLMVFQKVPNKEAGITSTWRKETFQYLLEFAEKQVMNGSWISDKLFSLFMSDLHTDRLWPLSTGLMQIFWDHLEKSTVYVKPSMEVITNLCTFTSHYAYNRCDTVYILAHYLIPLKGDDKSGVSRDCLLDSNKSLSQSLSIFISKFEGIVPGFSPSEKGWYNSFKTLTNVISDFLISKGIAEYPDVKEAMLHMLDTAEELKSLEKVVEWVNGGENALEQIALSEPSVDNIDMQIQYFDSKITNLPPDIRERNIIKQEIDGFFEKLKGAENLVLTGEQIKSLHQLVSKIVEQFSIQSIWYRRIILKHSRKE